MYSTQLVPWLWPSRKWCGLLLRRRALWPEGGRKEVQIIRAKAPKKPRDSVSPSMQYHLDPYKWVLWRGSKGALRGNMYLFCHPPGGHSRRKAAPGGRPRWPLARAPPLPKATAGPSPRRCVPASGPVEKRRKATVSHGAPGPTTHYKLATHTHAHCGSCHSQLTPCAAAGQQGERGSRTEVRERSPQQNLLPRNCVPSHQRLKAFREPPSSSEKSQGPWVSPWCPRSLGITSQAD